MDGAAASATIEILIQNLISVSKEEISLIRGLDKSAEKLKGSLGMIQKFLDDAQKKFIAEEAVKTWLKELEAVAFDADNVLDELNYQLLSNKMKSIEYTKKKKVSSCFPSFDHCVHRRQIALRIKEINTNFESIDKRATTLHLERGLADAPAAAYAASETDSVTVDPIFIGRDVDVSKIVEKLTTPTEQTLSVLPIVGMGGLGKTTLARTVFNHEKTKTFFGKHIWVHVSQNFDAFILLKKILANLKGENVEVVSRDDLLKKLQEALDAKTYLLVLDDVWNQDRKKWEDFINSWSGITSMKGNVIIVTTRNTEVGSIVKTLDIHHLNGLSEEQCWSIIKDKAFKGGDIPPGLEAIGRSIAERCHGLPLAANVVGGVLRDKSPEEWLSVKENWLSDVGGDENNISEILKLSFHHLPSPSLKKCFAYCSIFPKGARVHREDLIELWMAEGFLQTEQTKDMEIVGNKNFNLLVQSSLLQVVDRDTYGNAKRCSMHDLVHDVASSVLGFPKVNDNISGGICGARYIRWECNGDESSCIPKDQAKWLRTLFVDEVSDIIFSNFKSLHVLTLMSYNDEELPDSIRELIHLRYLHISSRKLRYLPDWIGKLYYLQTLRAKPTKLPSTLKYLINLRHLHVPDTTEKPPQLGMLTSLQTLSYFKVRDEEGHRIVELGSLKNLKGKLKIDNLENVQGEEESKKAYLFQKSGIVELVLRWNESREGEINDENVLKGLQPQQNLKMLEINGFKGESFPSWTSKMAVCLEGHWLGLDNLMEVKLSSCVECEEIPTMGHLPRLKSVYLSSLRNVKSIGSSFYGIDNCTSYNGVCNVFPVLERLELMNMPNLTEWVGVEACEVKLFPCLQYLQISSCSNLRSSPSQFNSLKELSIFNMDRGLPLANICGIQLKTLTQLIIWDLEGLTCLPDWLFHNNQHLSKLVIRNCPNLSELPDGMHSLSSLELLTLWECRNLKTIPYSISGGQKLQVLDSLSIWGCPGLKNFPSDQMVESSLYELSIDARGSESWDCASFKTVVGGMLQLGSHSLRRISLGGKEDWDSLPDQLQHLTVLSTLEVDGFGIQKLPEWFGNFSSLSTLHLIRCMKLACLPSVEAMRCLTNLSSFSIRDCPLLKENGIKQRSDDHDSEWPKISHIPNICVDWRWIQEGGRMAAVKVRNQS